MSSASQHEVAAWEGELAQSEAAWQVLSPKSAVSSGGATLSLLADDSILATGANPDQDTYAVTLSPPPGAWSALRIELLTDDGLPQQGPGRQDNGNLHLSEIELFSGGTDGERIPITMRTLVAMSKIWLSGRASNRLARRS